MDKWVLSRGKVPLDVLRQGSVRARLLSFYRLFGVQPWSKTFTFWSSTEVATVIGHVADDGKPTPSQINTLRRTRRQLTAEGRLRKVKRCIQGVWVYSWAYVPERVPQAALDILNAKSGRVVWCNPGDEALVKYRDRLDDIPLVGPITTSRGDPWSWTRALSGLLDFSNPEVWNFWTSKAPSALAGKGHPLRMYSDVGLRLQIGLDGVERGLERNLRSNLGWEPRDPVAWTLGSLKKYVGKEKTWTVPDEEIRDIIALRLEADLTWLRTLAGDHLKEAEKAMGRPVKKSG